MDLWICKLPTFHPIFERVNFIKYKSFNKQSYNKSWGLKFPNGKLMVLIDYGSFKCAMV